MSKRYGYIPDLPDRRDRSFKLSTEPILPKVDLRDQMPPVYDQKNLGSCTANAIAAAFQYEHIKQGLENFIPSRLFIYFNERVKENTVRSDAGAQIRDGIKSVASQGVCPENVWPYIIERFDIRPPTSCYQEAKKHTSIQYESISNSPLNIMESLSRGFPVIFGFTVYDSFESPIVESTGKVPLLQYNERVRGGHAVLCVGYDTDLKHFIIRNSWGTDWGDEGYCYMSFGYLEQVNADDCWNIQLVT